MHRNCPYTNERVDSNPKYLTGIGLHSLRLFTMSSSGNDTFGFRHGLAIAQLVFFSPAILYAYYFRRTGRIGDFCIGVFSILRVVGASARLASLNSASSSLRTTTFVCESLGIILLTFLYLEFPKRMYVPHCRNSMPQIPFD